MTNTTDKSILTAAGKALLAQLNAEEKPLIIDKMIFANMPNRPEFPQPNDVVPTDDVVHQEGVEQRGRLSVDSVIYSTTLTSDIGPFEFNWTGAFCSEYGVLVTIDHHALTPKTTDEPGVSGNTLVRSVVLEYKDIAEITNITVDASSWQYNATPRMKKMDSDTAQAIIDQNGKDWFIEDGFIVTPQATAYNIKAGAGYVSGNRVTLEFDRNVQVPNKPSFIYVDAHREGTPTGEQVTLFDFVVTAEEKDDYTDANGVKHFVCKIAQVLADDSVSDLRPEGESADKGFVNTVTNGAMFQSLNLQVFPENVKEYLVVGDKDRGEIPKNTTAVRIIKQDGRIQLYLMSNKRSGVVKSIDLDSGIITFNDDTVSFLAAMPEYNSHIKYLSASQFGVDVTGEIDSTVKFQRFLDFCADTGVYIRESFSTIKVSDKIRFRNGVKADFGFSTLIIDMEGLEGVGFYDSADVCNLIIKPSDQYKRKMPADINDTDIPVDDFSHGAVVTERCNLRDIYCYQFKGFGWIYWSTGNMNSSQLHNLRGYNCNFGHYFKHGGRDDFSICEGSFYAYGNASSGFFAQDDFYFRQNKFFIRSEYNNLNAQNTVGSRIIDVYLGKALYSDLFIYSEGSKHSNYNIYTGDNCIRSNVVSVRQDKDHINGSCSGTMGTRTYKTGEETVSTIHEFWQGNGNPNDGRVVDVLMSRGTGHFGRLRGKDGGLYLAYSDDPNEVPLIGIDDKGAVLGKDFIRASKVTLNTSTPSVSIELTDIGDDKFISGKMQIEAISAGLAGVRQYHVSFNALNAVDANKRGVTYGGESPDNINSHPDSYSSFTVSIENGKLYLNLSYQPGNLGGAYYVNYQVNFTLVN